MIVQAENPSPVDRDHLVHAVAEDEAAVERRDARPRQRQKLSVQVDDAVIGGCRAVHGAVPCNESALVRSGAQRSHWSMRRRLSHVRTKTFATPTPSSATTGYSP